MKSKEPEFMQELHRIRAELSKEWRKMSNREFVKHMHKVGENFKQSSASRKTAPTSHPR